MVANGGSTGNVFFVLYQCGVMGCYHTCAIHISPYPLIHLSCKEIGHVCSADGEKGWCWLSGIVLRKMSPACTCGRERLVCIVIKLRTTVLNSEICCILSTSDCWLIGKWWVVLFTTNCLIRKMGGTSDSCTKGGVYYISGRWNCKLSC